MVSMSARVGSISDNDIGGWYSYRASKSALNQLNRCMVRGYMRYPWKLMLARVQHKHLLMLQTYFATCTLAALRAYAA